MTIELRSWSPGDASALHDAYASSPDLVNQFGTAILATVELAEEFISKQLPFTDTSRNWAITTGGVAVGNVGLSAIEWRHETAWAYYWLSASARGRGYAAYALAAVSDWAFARGLFRLELGHRVNNPASCGVARRAGFMPEGIERQKLRYGDERFDVETHARLRTDPFPSLTDTSLIRS
ncbi:GNAT family N-acetyltransferase [Arthrobacter castelli]|uniref:GNAT family N-acetyltransferase n=1 Tax=Arthrobacter castelli TaxID=271431 RepID=UPI00047AEF44|nr:GNAT family N-acetyltransferase [Arthrobacter castelli]